MICQRGFGCIIHCPLQFEAPSPLPILKVYVNSPSIRVILDNYSKIAFY